MTGSGSVINLNSGAKLSFNDSNKEAEHRFTVSNAQSNGARLATVDDGLTSGYKTFTGGYITGGSAREGGILVGNNAYLTMNGGTIIGNQSSFMGAGVKVSNNGDDDGKCFTMNGGSIIYNSISGYGSGVCSDAGVTITGGVIACNYASNYPGGVHGHYLYISGGRIENNFAGNSEYAAGVHADHEVFLSGDTVIYGNLCNGSPYNLDWDRVEYKHGHMINLTGALSEEAKIGVTLRITGTGTFTSGWNDKMGNADPAKYFTSDNDAYEVYLNSSGEAEIGNLPHEHDNLSFKKWSSTTSLPTSAGNYYLSADVTISSRWDVPTGAPTNLDLNGHGITRTNASDTTGSVIQVGSGATLNLYDCGTDTRYYTVANPSVNGAGLGTIVDEAAYNAADENARGTFKGGFITGGVISGAADGNHLIGGVNVDCGSFTMNGGTIIGNKVCINAGGVKVRGAGASFTMNGGAILANYNDCYGGGISVGDNAADHLCTLTINEGLIARNWSGRNGGAIHLDGKAHTVLIAGGICAGDSDTTVSVTGGVIKNNITQRFASGIWAGRTDSSVFMLGGDAQIIDNISMWSGDRYGEGSINYINSLRISGDPTVHGDWKEHVTSTVHTHINLDDRGSGIEVIEPEGALTNDTGSPKLGISPISRWDDLESGQTFVFTKNWDEYMGTAHPANYFKVDDSVSGVTIIRKDGEAAVTGSGDLGDLYITFDANKGEGEMDPQLATSTTAALNENTFTRDGYVFAGWNTKADGDGASYKDKDNITLTGDLTLYAQWEEALFEGKGTEEEPYLIQSAEDWDALSSYINSGGTSYSGKHFKLTKNISVTTTLGNRPNPRSDSEDNFFSGVFDGDNHTLEVNINDPIFAAPVFTRRAAER